MVWPVALGVLMAPVCLLYFSRHLLARLCLLLLSVGCGIAGVAFFKQARAVEEDMRRADIYELPSSTGVHKIELARLSQVSMEAVLHGGSEKPNQTDLEKFKWSLSGNSPGNRWFHFETRDDVDPLDTPLFQVDWGGPKLPLTLEYQVEESDASILHGRSIWVRHDRGALHMLRNHLLPILNLFGWSLALWGGLWILIQGIVETRRHLAKRVLVSP
jgi:hypothetical protein